MSAMHTVTNGLDFQPWPHVFRRLCLKWRAFKAESGPNKSTRLYVELNDMCAIVQPLLEEAWVTSFRDGQTIPGLDTGDVLQVVKDIAEAQLYNALHWQDIRSTIAKRLEGRGYKIPKLD